MARRTLNRHELRAAVEAAEARGLGLPETPKKDRESEPRRAKPDPKVRMRVVWAVCDVGGRTVQTFDYTQKVQAEALAQKLKAERKGPHFVRAVKEPM
jgi:hypothetical protein